MHDSWPDTNRSSCTVGAFPPLFADPCFPVQSDDSQHTVCVVEHPQVPRRHTNPSIHDDTCTTRGRIRTAARAWWVPSPHFLGFCPAPRHWNSRPRALSIPASQNRPREWGHKPTVGERGCSTIRGPHTASSPLPFPVDVLRVRGPECIAQLSLFDLRKIKVHAR